MNQRPSGSRLLSACRIARGSVLTVLVSSLLVWADAATADPTFGGAYDVVDVTPLGETQAKVRLRLRVQNVSGGYVANTTISIREEAGAEDLGAFLEPLNLDQLGSATLEATVNVDLDLAAQWLGGVPIQFEAAYIDESGQVQRRLVDAPRMPLGEGM